MDTIYTKFITQCEERDTCVGCPYNHNDSVFTYADDLDICLALYIYENYDLVPKDTKEELNKDAKEKFDDAKYEYKEDEE